MPSAEVIRDVAEDVTQRCARMGHAWELPFYLSSLSPDYGSSGKANHTLRRAQVHCVGVLWSGSGVCLATLSSFKTS